MWSGGAEAEASPATASNMVGTRPSLPEARALRKALHAARGGGLCALPRQRQAWASRRRRPAAPPLTSCQPPAVAAAAAVAAASPPAEKALSSSAPTQPPPVAASAPPSSSPSQPPAAAPRTAKRGPPAGAVPETSPFAVARGGETAAAAANELTQAEQYARAAAELRKAIELEADDFRSLQHRVNLGCTFHRMGATDHALASLTDSQRRLEKLRPRVPAEADAARKRLNFLEAIININLACSKKGEPQVQRKHFETALRLSPDSGEARFHMASLLEKEGDLEGALEHLRHAVKINTEDLNCLALTTRCLERLGRHREALTIAQRLCGLDVASTYIALKEVFRCKERDAFVVTYPRCGTTWMVQVVTCVLHGASADYNEHGVFVEGAIATASSWIWTLEDMKPPRILKMHVPAEFHPGLLRGSEVELQEHGKAVYVVRNPKDALVSLRHHHANNASIAWNGTWEEWLEQWLAGDRSREYGGTYFEHVKGWWQLARKHPDRVLIVYFEDMKANLAGTIRQVADFLGRDVSDVEVQKMAERCSFQAMKGNHKVYDDVKGRINPIHFRKGDVGSWRAVLSEEQGRRVDKATWENLREEIAQGLQIHGLPPEQPRSDARGLRQPT